jgi:chromosome segregation ATPase
MNQEKTDFLKEIEELHNRREQLHESFQQLEMKIRLLQGKNDDDSTAYRKALQQDRAPFIAKFNQIKERLAEIEKARFQHLCNVIKDTLPMEQVEELLHEHNRRMRGEPPFRPSLPTNREEVETYEAYKKLAQNSLNTLIKARVIMNKIMLDGCSRYGNVEFIKLMSPLNSLLSPVPQVETLKKQFNLK